MTGNPAILPPGLPEPEDDGASDHLLGLALPDTEFAATSGETYSVHDVLTRWLVLYVYPRTGGPGVDLPDDWDLIPGARGCTPQSCAFRDNHTELQELGATVWGLSAQDISEQRAFAQRMHISFPLLNDSALKLTEPPLRLPTFAVSGKTLYRRLTLLIERGRIQHVWYPVFPPDRNAEEVIEYLASQA